jgi:hypothetical protein
LNRRRRRSNRGHIQTGRKASVGGRDATNRCRSGSQDCGATGGDDLFGRPLSGSSYASVRESELRRHLAHFQQWDMVFSRCGSQFWYVILFIFWIF